MKLRHLLNAWTRLLLVLIGGLSASQATMAQQGFGWTPCGPTPLYASAMSFDSARGRSVLFGGSIGNNSFQRQTGDTWEWDGATWHLRAVAGPSPRAGHAMAFDSARGKTVLFGGAGEDGLNGETWEWDGTAWTERAVPGPSPRTGHVMAYDFIRGVTVLHGGDVGANLSDETWEWNGTAWTLRLNTGPGARKRHSSAFDGLRGVTVMFGGATSASTGVVADTWEWDGASWTQRASAGPTARSGQVMVYDGTHQRTLLWGGSANNGGALLGDTWEWNGQAWTQQSASGPAARWRPAMAFDPIRGVAVLFGGEIANAFAGDTWEWDGSAWAQRGVAGPRSISMARMAYDESRGVTVLASSYPPSNGTWEWNGLQWTRRSATGPSFRFLEALTYDAARQRVVLFGGATGSAPYVNNETWEWNGTSWLQRPVGGPSPRSGHAMVYDERRGVVVLFGGSGGGGSGGGLSGETWEWDGSVWIQRLVSGPSPRQLHAMAYDSGRGVTVLFGGYTGAHNGETWEWDGTTWTQRIVNGPLPRSSPSMAYDSARGVTLLFGGDTTTISGSGGTSDTWEWDGTSWTEQSLAGPFPRNSQGMVYDSLRSEVVLFGGQSGGVAWGDTWTFRCSEPVVTTQPQTLSLFPNTTAEFEVHAQGPQVSYQWRRSGAALANGGRISGAQSPILTIANVQSVDQGAYDCQLSNPCGTLTSESASLSCGPVVLSQPDGFTPLTVETQLSVSVPANAFYTYRWRQAGQNLFNIPGVISGVTTRTLTLHIADPSLEGQYDLVVTNTCGTVTTTPTTVSICDAVDFNHDGLFPDVQDINDFLGVFAGGPCTNDPNCGDIDFNNDGLFPDVFDINSLLSVFSGGSCV